MGNSIAFANCFRLEIGGCYCTDDEEKQRLDGWIHMRWWMLIPMAAVIVITLYGLFRWASGAPEIDVENAREHFREEQDRRGLRRSGIDSAPHRQQ